MTPHEREAVGRMFEALSSLSNLRESQMQVLESFCGVSGAAGGQLTDMVAAKKSGRHYEVAVASPRYFNAEEAQRMERAALNCDVTELIPFFERVIQGAKTVSIHSKDIPKDEYLRSKFYKEIVRPSGYTETCAIFLKERPGACRFAAGIGTFHPRRFTKRHVFFLEALSPGAGRGLENLAAWHERWEDGQAWEGLLHAAEEPLVALQRRRRQRTFEIACASQGAAELLGLGQTTTMRNLNLQEFLKAAPFALGARAGTLTWTALDGRPYRLFALKAQDHGSPDLLLVRLQPLHHPGLHPADDQTAALRKGLTMREAEVFSLFAQGQSDHELAKKLNISYHTARAHTRRIFEKLGVSNRTEAINTVRR